MIDHLFEVVSKLHPASQVVAVGGGLIVAVFVIACAALIILAIIKSL